MAGACFVMWKSPHEVRFNLQRARHYVSCWGLTATQFPHVELHSSEKFESICRDNLSAIVHLDFIIEATSEHLSVQGRNGITIAPAFPLWWGRDRP